MKKRIFFSGGGTLGSVMPLLALWEELRKDYDCFWVGSLRGIEKEYIKERKIKYLGIPSGKIRKYFSFKNFLAPIFVIAGLKISFLTCLFYRPKLIIVSGSFISVPLVWAGWLLKIPIIVHQEDIRIGLAGKLTFPLARKITSAFENRPKGAIWIGNPIRKIFYNINTKKAKERFKKTSLPLVLVLGGGLGSEKINNELLRIASKINDKCEILDITGKGKKKEVDIKNYKQIETLDEDFADVLAVADIVVSRAGASTLSELSFLGKPVILIPLESVGQKENAMHFVKKDAAIIIEEKDLEKLEGMILNLLKDKKKQEKLKKNIKKMSPQNPTKNFLEVIQKIL